MSTKYLVVPGCRVGANDHRWNICWVQKSGRGCSEDFVDGYVLTAKYSRSGVAIRSQKFHQSEKNYQTCSQLEQRMMMRILLEKILDKPNVLQ
jgi:hypothetical protein